MTAVDILIADDDTELSSRLSKALVKEGYTVRHAGGPKAVKQAIDEKRPDLLLLDIDFSSSEHEEGGAEDGIALLKGIRRSADFPIIMLSSVSVNMVKVYALTVGADDYLTKPFVSAELLARVKAVLRRSMSASAASELLEVHGIRVDAGARQAWKHGAELELTALEFDLLLAFVRMAGRVMSREQIIAKVWDHDYFGDPRVVDVHIMNLRRRIEDNPGSPTRIVTVRGRGYRFETEPAPDAAAP